MMEDNSDNIEAVPSTSASVSAFASAAAEAGFAFVSSLQVVPCTQTV